MICESAPLLVLVGPPGAGKTTVGQLLAHRLGVEFADADALIVERAGRSIADMFTEDGEDAFRALERAVVTEALTTTAGVLALGGGAVLDAGTRERLRGHRVVWLSVGLADGLRRTGMTAARPLLAGVNPRATFRALLDARAPLYREVATVEVDTGGRSPGEVVLAVLVALGELPADAVLPGGVAAGSDLHSDLPGSDLPGSDLPGRDQAAEGGTPAGVEPRDLPRPVPLPDPTVRP